MRRWLKPIGFAALGLCLLAGTGLVFRKAITAVAIEWVLERAVGVSAKVKVEALGPQSAEADVSIQEPALHFSKVRVQWWLRGFFPPKIEAELSVEEKDQSALGLRVTGLLASARATVEGARLVSALAEGGAAGIERGDLKITSSAFSFTFGKEGLRIRGAGLFPWGKTEAKFEAPEARLEGEVSAKGKFTVGWPKGSCRGAAEFRFDPGFHSGTARFADLALTGTSFGAGRVSGQFEKKGEQSRLSLELPKLEGKDFSTASPFPVRIDLNGKGVSFEGAVRGNPWAKGAGFVADGAEVKATFDWATSALAARAKLVAVRSPGTIQPLEASIEGSGTEQKVTFAVEARDLLGEAWIEGKGTWTAKDGAQLDLVKDFDLGGGNFDLSNLLELEDTFTPRAGKFQLRARGRWQPGKAIRISGTVRGDGLSFDYAGIPCSDLSFRVPVRRAWPLELDGKASASFGAMGSVIPLRHLHFSAAQSGKRIQVEKLETDWGDGKVRVEPFLVTVEPLGFEASVLVEKVDAESLLKEAAAGQIKAKGVLVGKLPIAWKDGYLHVTNGLLSSGDTSGWIQYKDPTITGLPEKIADLEQFEKLLAQGQQALAFKALDNFFFKSAQIRLERSPGKGLEAFLSLAGHNPDLANGMPFQFQIGLTGQLESAVKQSVLRGLMRPEAFTEYLKKK